jgi:hypothetical protein
MNRDELMDVRVNKKGDISRWSKGDILDLMKEFGVEALKYQGLGSYYGYVYSNFPDEYDRDIVDITNVHWHGSSADVKDNYIIFYIVGKMTDYMYIPYMNSRMRDLQIRKII